MPLRMPARCWLWPSIPRRCARSVGALASSRQCAPVEKLLSNASPSVLCVPARPCRDALMSARAPVAFHPWSARLITSAPCPSRSYTQDATSLPAVMVYSMRTRDVVRQLPCKERVTGILSRYGAQCPFESQSSVCGFAVAHHSRAPFTQRELAPCTAAVATCAPTQLAL